MSDEMKRIWNEPVTAQWRYHASICLEDR